MNRLLVLTVSLAILLVQSVGSQDLRFDEQTKKYFTEKEISNEAFKKDTLYTRTLKWLYRTFPGTGEKGTYIDAAKGKIEARQYFTPDPKEYRDMTNLRIGFLITCNVEDRKYSYRYSDLYYYSSGDGRIKFDTHKFRHYDVLLRDKLLEEAKVYIKKSSKELESFVTR